MCYFLVILISAFINTVELNQEESTPNEDRYELLVTNLKVPGLNCNFYFCSLSIIIALFFRAKYEGKDIECCTEHHKRE